MKPMLSGKISDCTYWCNVEFKSRKIKTNEILKGLDTIFFSTFKPLHATGPFLCPLETVENQSFPTFQGLQKS